MEVLYLPLNVEEEKEDMVLKRITQKNREELRRKAEMEKIGLVKKWDDDIKGFEEKGIFLDDLTVLVNGQEQPGLMHDKQVKITKDEFNKKLGELLEPAIQKLGELVDKVFHDKNKVALVLLSGQSSAFPLVKEKIKEKLNIEDEKIQRLEKPKECVVRGLCILQSDEPSAGMSVRVDPQGSLSATTSRLGLKVRDRGQFRFKQLVGVGKPIGKDGITKEVDEIDIKRNTKLTLYEHMGPETDNSCREGDRRIHKIKEFRIPDKLAEVENSGLEINDEIMKEAELWFTIKPNQQIELEIRFKPEHKISPIKFEAIRPGY